MNFAAKKIISYALAITMTWQPVAGYAGMIVATGRTQTTINSNGNMHDIRTGTIHGNTAFNDFSVFDVWKNNVVNMHLDGAQNLVNLVHDKHTAIDGVLNSFKNGQIGGNVFFLNPNGIAVGADGVVNVGALTFATPTRDFMNNVIGADGNINDAAAAAILAGDMPIGATGLVSVQGQINATDGVGIRAGFVQHNGQIRTAFDASAIVNADNAELDNQVFVSGGRVIIGAEKDADIAGKIETNGSDISITAKNDIELNAGADVSSSASGNKDAGEIYIFADNNSTFDKGAKISADADLGDGGFIEFSAKKSVLLNGGEFSAQSNGGNFGKIFIDPESLTINANITSNGEDYELTSGDLRNGTITIGNNVVINTSAAGKNSGNISLSARDIILNDFAKLISTSTGAFNAGNITLLAGDSISIGKNVEINALALGTGTSGDVSLSVLHNVVEPWWKRGSASITIGNAAKIFGNNVDISIVLDSRTDLGESDLTPDMFSEDAFEGWGEFGESLGDVLMAMLEDFADLIFGGLEDVGFLPLVLRDYNLKSSITIGSAEITALNDLNISSTINSEIDMMLTAPLFDISFAWLKNHTDSSITIGSGANLTGKALDISSVVNTTTAGAASATSLIQEIALDTAFAALAANVAQVKSRNKIDIQSGAKLIATGSDTDGNAAVKINATTNRNVATTAEATSSAAYLGAAVNYYHEDVLNEVLMNGEITANAAASVDISSAVIGDVSTLSVSIVGPQSETLQTLITDNIVAKLKAALLKAKTPEQLEAINQKMGSHGQVGISAVVNYIDMEQSKASVSVGGTINAGKDINVSSRNETGINSGASAKISATTEQDPLKAQDRAKQNKENGGAASVNIAEYNLSAATAIGGSANLSAGGDINITSDLIVPVKELDVVKLLKDTLLGLKVGIFIPARVPAANRNIGSYILDEIEKLADRIVDQFSTSGADSIVDVSSAESKDAAQIGIAGSVNILEVNTNSSVSIADGANLSAGKDIKVSATTDTYGFDVIGPIKLAGVEGTGGIGASAGYTAYNATTRVGVGAANITANKLDIDATTTKLAMLASVSGGEMESWGFAGTFGYINSATDTTAALNSGASLNLSGSLELNATTDEIYITIGGGVIDGAAVGIGASASLVDVVSNTRAYISGAAQPANAFNVVGDVSVAANQNNDIYNFAIAGAIATTESDAGGSEQNSQTAQTGDNSNQRYGIGVSGAASYNSVSGTTEAYIKNAKINAKNINVSATDSSAIITAAGGATIRTDAATDDKLGLAGAASVNWLDNKVVSAYIDNSEITASQNVNVSAKSSNSIIAISAGGSIAPTADVSIAGSVSINEVETDVNAYVNASTISAGNTAISADDDSAILAIAGAIGVGEKVGGGAAVGVNNIKSVVDAYSQASFLDVARLGITALTQPAILAIGVAVGATTGKVGIGASVGVNDIYSSATAFIKGGGVNVSGADNEDGNALIVRATNEASIDSGAGGGGGSGAVGAGISTSVNDMDASAIAYISGVSEITTPNGGALVQAISNASASSYAAGVGVGAGTHGVGAAGSVAVSNINTLTTASIDDSKLTLGGKLSVNADATNEIKFYGGSVGLGGAVGAGGTIAYNGMSGDTSAYVNDSEISATGGLDVYANFKSDVQVYSGTIAAAANAGVAVMATITDIANKVAAYIGLGSKITNTGSVLVNANSEIDVQTYGGALAGAGDAGFGAAVDTLLLANSAEAYVQDSEITSTGDIAIKSKTTEGYDAIVASMAVGGVSGAGNVIVVDSESASLAYADNSKLNANKSVSIDAVGETALGKDSELGFGAASIGGTAGLAGAVFVGLIDNVVRAFANDTHINAQNNVSIAADLKQSSRMVMPTAAAGVGTAGVAASVSVIDFGYETESYVSETKTDGTKITSRNSSISITANTDSSVNNVMAGIAAGASVAGGGAVSVASIHGNTTAAVKSRAGATDGIELTAATNVNVDAESTRSLSDVVIAAGASLMASLAGSVSVAMFGGALSADAAQAIGGASDIIQDQLALNSETQSGGAGRNDLVDDTNFGKSADFDFSGAAQDSGTSAYLGEYTNINASSLHLYATDTISSTQHAGGGALGVGLDGVGVALGASVAYTGIDTSALARIGDNSTIKLRNDLSVAANVIIDDSSNAYFASASAGEIAVAAGGAVSIFDAAIESIAAIGRNVDIDLSGNMSVNANTDVDVDSMIIGGAAALGLGAGVGAAVTIIDVDSNLTATIGDDTTIGDEATNKGASNVSIYVNEDTDITSDNYAIGVGLAGLAGNGVDINVGGNAKTIIGNGVDIVSKNLSVYANAARSVLAQVLGVAAGALGVGVNVVYITARGSAETEISDNTNLYVSANAIINSDMANSLYAEMDAGTGGAVAAGGAQIDIDNSTTAKVDISDSAIYANNLDIHADNFANQDFALFAVNAGLANVGALNGDNLANITSSVNLTGTDIIAGIVDILANNDFVKNKYSANLDTIGAGLLGVGVYSNKTDITTNANVNIDGGATILATGENKYGASLNVNAFNDIYSHDYSKMISAGLVNVVVLNNETTATANANVNVRDANIKTSNDANFNAKTDADILAKTGINVFGAAAVSHGEALAELSVNNNINFATGAELLIFGDLGIGMSSIYGQGDQQTKINVEAMTDIFNATAFSIGAGSGAAGKLSIASNLDIASGAVLKSSGAVFISAHPGFYSTFGMLNKITAGLALSFGEEARDVSESLNSNVNIDGVVISGATNNIDISITGNKDNGYVVSTTQATDTGEAASNSHTKNVNENEDAVAGQIGDIRYTIASEDQADNLMRELSEYQRLYNIYASDDVMGPAYLAEIERIKSELVRQGLYGNSIRNTITFDDMSASRGHIYILADNLTGSGTLQSKGDAKVSIINDSDMDMRLQNISISGDYEGKIYFGGREISSNDGIENKNGVASNLNISSSANQGAAPVIEIANGYNSKKLELAINKSISNLSGDVNIAAGNDFYSRGNIYAAKLDLRVGGAITQSYSEGITHIGGDPASQWSAEAGNFQNEHNGQGDATTGSKGLDDVKSSLGGGWYAENVYISGRYINVNGTIQAGYASLDVVIPADFQVKIPGTNTYMTPQQAQVHNNGGNIMYEILTNGNIVARYDAKNDKIYLVDAIVQGGNLELYGTILNTDGNGGGRLVALDGYAAINITNNSTKEVVLANVDNSQRVNGRIKITNIGIGRPTEITEFTYRDGKIYANNSAVSNGRGEYRWNGLERGLRYAWGTGNQTGTRTTELYQTDGWLWGAIDVEQDDLISSNFESFGTPQRLPDGTIVFVDDKLPSFWANYQRKVLNADIKEREWSTCGFLCFKKSYYLERITQTTNQNNWNFSVKADYPINISFIGSDTAQDINISSVGGLTLNGGVRSARDISISTQGDIETSTTQAIIARNLTLNAAGEIGNAQHILNIDIAGAFNATARGGDMAIDSLRDLNVQKISATGNVIIDSGGYVRGISDQSEIIANVLNIVADDVDINTSVNEISVSATGDIIVNNDKSLAVDTIISTGGDVALNVDGDITNAGHEVQHDTRTLEEKLAIWNDLDLFGEAGWTTEMLSRPVRAANMSQPTGIWEMKDPNIVGRNVAINATGSVGTNAGVVSIDLTSELTDEQRDILNNAQAHNVHMVYGEDGRPITANVSQVDDVNITASESLQVDANGSVYIGSNTDVKLDHIYSNDGGNITLYSGGGIENVAVAGQENIRGGDVYLGATNGDIGSSDKEILVNAEIISAGAVGNIYINSGANNMMVGDRGVWANGGLARLTTLGDIDVVDGDVISIEGDRIELIAGGAIGFENSRVGMRATDASINAGGDVNLRVDSPDVRFDFIDAGGALNLIATGNLVVDNFAALIDSIIAKGDIYINAAAGESLLVSRVGGATNISGRAVNMVANDGQIGRSDAAVYIAGTDLVSLTLDDDVFVEVDTPKLVITKSNPGIVQIESVNDLHIAGGIVNAGGAVSIISGGGISSDDTIIGDEILARADGDVSLTTDAAVLSEISSVNGNIDIESIMLDDIYVGLIRAENGNVYLKSAGELDIGTAYSKNIMTIIAGDSLVGGDSITGRIISIIAGNNIGSENSWFTINSADLAGSYRFSAGGDLYVRGFDRLATLNTITAGGNAHINAADNAGIVVDDLGGAANVIAQNIWLNADTGAIGLADNMIVVRTNDDKGKINLYAADGIYLRNITGDLLSDYIVNWRSGDIVLHNLTNDVQINHLARADGFKMIFDRVNDSVLEIMGADVEKLSLAHSVSQLYRHMPDVRFGWFKDIAPAAVEYENLEDL